ncbi:PREDICTED: uncharacterized protein LOC107354430 [Acropora digitifera]|uniref:uncharacterized protein LOC107354430 n=1 Tax=Acropora digitifera TaxID=70779 RepID=UPI00077AD151|nr:PREDICTED: uncharacterized protein LOC107354430 [Acropora digitifera]
MSLSLMLSMLIAGIIFPRGIISQDTITITKVAVNNCVSGGMQVEELTKGNIAVSQLSNGDIIRGVRGADRVHGWCRVEAVCPRKDNEMFITYDGFTADHMVIDADAVHAYGKKGNATKSRLYTLATECDAAVNAAGQAFTPISTAFCPHELSWSEYLPLMAAIRRVTSRTGYFWYFSDAFFNNETARVPEWKNMLHDMCTELLRCAREGQCQKFEKVVKEFVHEHMNPKYRVIVDHMFPNIGGDVEKSETGTITELVRPQKKSNPLLFLVVGSAVAMVLIIIAAAFLVRRARVTRKAKTTTDLTQVTFLKLEPKTWRHEDVAAQHS